MAKFKFVTGLNYVGCKEEEIVEIPDEILEGLSEDERLKEINEWYNEWKFEQTESKSWWEELK